MDEATIEAAAEAAPASPIVNEQQLNIENSVLEPIVMVGPTFTSLTAPSASVPAAAVASTSSKKKTTASMATMSNKRPSLSHSSTTTTTAASTITTSTAVTTPSTTTTTTTSAGSTRLRVYKSIEAKWVTREIAALDFLLGIPMQEEQSIVHQGWLQQQGIDSMDKKYHQRPKNARNIEANVGITDIPVNQIPEDRDEEAKMEVLEPPSESLLPSNHANNHTTSSHHGRWWEKWINNPNPKNPPVTKQGLVREEDDEDEEQGQETYELEQPSHEDMDLSRTIRSSNTQSQQQQVVPVLHAPGRRLQGDEATRVQIPLTVDTITRQRSIARLAAIREWELQVAHGISNHSKATTMSTSTASGNKTLKSTSSSSITNTKTHPPLLDGRLFFSAAGSYPLEVFSLLRYEPKKEEAARRRKKLEARGGGGTQFFIMPERDWRGISYRALLHTKQSTKPFHIKKKRRKVSKEGTDLQSLFDRFQTQNDADNRAGKADNDHSSAGSLSVEDSDDDEEEDTYVPGVLDDPEMVQGRHRHVMIGDRVTGCIVSSTILFVQPSLLKADLNKQFRERFDGWEPPKSQRKYIGARVIDGVYTLMEPGEQRDNHESQDLNAELPTSPSASSLPAQQQQRSRQSSSTSVASTMESTNKEIIRMPPSLTLSKLRSVKHQALLAAVKAKLELGTVALAFVYFERLCLDCRVDKTNRRLSFAACLLLAIKINEAHVGLVMTKQKREHPQLLQHQADNTNSNETSKSNMTMNKARIKSFIRPTKKSSTMFASLLEFFTQDWQLSLQHLFAAEWGVFAALQFRLHATPSQVAFHFKRLLKAMDWNPRTYLGAEMYGYWQQELAREEYLRQERKARQEARHQKKEQEKLLQLKRELEQASRREKLASSSYRTNDESNISKPKESSSPSAGVVKTSALDDPSGSPRRSEVNNHNSTSGFVDQVRSPIKPQRSSSRISGIKLLNRFGGKRALSTDKLILQQHKQHEVTPMSSINNETNDDSITRLQSSPSMPAIAGSFDTYDDFVIDLKDDKDNLHDKDNDNKSIVDDDDGGGIII